MRYNHKSDHRFSVELNNEYDLLLADLILITGQDANTLFKRGIGLLSLIIHEPYSVIELANERISVIEEEQKR